MFWNKDTAPGERRGVLVVREVKNLSDEQRRYEKTVARWQQFFLQAGLKKFNADVWARKFADRSDASEELALEFLTPVLTENGEGWLKGSRWEPANTGDGTLERCLFIRLLGPEEAFWEGIGFPIERSLPNGERKSWGGAEDPFPLQAAAPCRQCKGELIGPPTYPTEGDGWHYDREPLPLHHRCRKAYYNGYAAVRKMAERD